MNLQKLTISDLKTILINQFNTIEASFTKGAATIDDFYALADALEGFTLHANTSLATPDALALENEMAPLWCPLEKRLDAFP